MLAGSLRAPGGRRFLSQDGLIPFLPPFPSFGPNLFQLFSMSCRCRLSGSREEVRKPCCFLPEKQKELQPGCGLDEKVVPAACVCGLKCPARETGYSARTVHKLPPWDSPPKPEGKEDLIQNWSSLLTALLVPVLSGLMETCQCD